MPKIHIIYASCQIINLCERLQIADVVFINSRNIILIHNNYDDIFMMLWRLNYITLWPRLWFRCVSLYNRNRYFCIDWYSHAIWYYRERIILEGKISQLIFDIMDNAAFYTFIRINKRVYFSNKKFRIPTREVLRMLLLQREVALFWVITFTWLSSNRRLAWVWNNERIILIAND